MDFVAIPTLSTDSAVLILKGSIIFMYYLYEAKKLIFIIIIHTVFI